MSRQPINILGRGYSPAKGRALNTANPPKGGSGVPPKIPYQQHKIKNSLFSYGVSNLKHKNFKHENKFYNFLVAYLCFT
jgi:hypothetical protein